MNARELNNNMGPSMNKYACPGCGYTYDESIGDDHEGYPPGFLFSDLPDDFVCPACSVRYKEDFVQLSLNPI
ncbi:MAG: rubredoxin [Flavobacterium sp.]|jgi:rubredoxin